ncbi:MAG TPA: thioredoxin family protein [Burkholderiaceae bacterium]|jgi:thiol-disulfide isomerase/thioredoxin|nr:thioredoxin family protein [Burkholderiaceae bacterium]
MSLLRTAAPGVAAGAAQLAVCLCAAWCDTCDAYRPVLERAAQQFPDARFIWLDIEDHEDLLGPIDVENFPTLLVAVDDDVRFFGTLTPQPETLARVLRASFAEGTGSEPGPEAAALLTRLRR